MRYLKTPLDGVTLLEPEILGDNRGYFFEAVRCDELERHLGHPFSLVQQNESSSAEGVVRGLHFQLPPYAQSKLVRVVRGAILDVAVDIRRGSPTFGQHVAVELSEENHRALFIPRGFAHGFSVLRGEAVVQYMCDNGYDKASEGAIAWNDAELNIDWGIEPKRAILSAKDLANRPLAECDKLFEYNINYYA